MVYMCSLACLFKVISERHVAQFQLLSMFQLDWSEVRNGRRNWNENRESGCETKRNVVELRNKHTFSSISFQHCGVMLGWDTSWVWGGGVE